MAKINQFNYEDFFKDRRGQARVARVGHVNSLAKRAVIKPADPAPGDSLVWNGTEWVAQASTGGGALPYKVYTALLSQSGTDAPVATVLQNTLGVSVVWSRDGAGAFTATFSLPIITNSSNIGETTNWVVIDGRSNNGDQLGGAALTWAFYGSSTEIYFEIYDITTGTKGDGFMQDMYLEIRVYP